MPRGAGPCPADRWRPCRRSSVGVQEPGRTPVSLEGVAGPWLAGTGEKQGLKEVVARV